MNAPTPKHKIIYILPNLFTAASVFTGVVSTVAAINGQFEKAAWLIFLSLLFDGLDGRVARLTKTDSRFGVEFDSLADVVAFGMAPALLIYMYAGQDFGRFGIVVSGLFVILGAVRLARFNVMTRKIEPSVFIGIPIPTAAVFLSILILLFEKYDALHTYKVVMLIMALLVALLMVSNVRYPSFKKIDLHKTHMVRTFVVLIVVAALIFLYPIEGFAMLIGGYILFGPLRALYLLGSAKRFKGKTK
jgi:CDP-diacylglycerol--serine O-phosphatidyltransferase